MSRAMRLYSSVLVVLAVGCGGAAASGAGGGGNTVPVARSGPPVDLLNLAPASAVVTLHADLDVVRSSARYDSMAGELATELGLTAESTVVRQLLDRTHEALGLMVTAPDGATQEGALLFSGSYAEGDFERALAIARSRHGGPGDEENGADGRRIVRLGDAAMIAYDQWTWAIVRGPTLTSHLAQASLQGPRGFRHDLIEFGPRIGLPAGSAQAWASQDTQVGADMVGLVFQGENPQMVHNFVTTVRRHLGL